MGEDRLEMGQKERDRLKVLHEADRQRITQRQAAEQLGITERQVRRLIARLRSVGDRAVVHGVGGRASSRRIDRKVERRAVAELSRQECRDFGPIYAAEHLRQQLGIQAGKDRVRRWMIGAGWWRSRKREFVEVHCWWAVHICEEIRYGCSACTGAGPYLLSVRSNRVPTRKNQSVAPKAFAITSGKKPVNDSSPSTPAITPVHAIAFPNLAFIIVMLASNTPNDGITIM
jgi:Homeodomain-like domain